MDATWEKRLADLDIAIINLDGANDDHALAHLASSLMVHWDDLPESLRHSIYELACSEKMAGLQKTVQIKQQIDRLLNRNGAKPPSS